MSRSRPVILLLSVVFLVACSGASEGGASFDVGTAEDTAPRVELAGLDLVEPDLDITRDIKPLPDPGALPDLDEGRDLHVAEILGPTDQVRLPDLSPEPDLAPDVTEDAAPALELVAAPDAGPDLPVGPCGGLPLTVASQGDLLPGVPLRMRPFGSCTEQRYWFVAAEGATISLELYPFAAMGDVEAVVTWPDRGDWDEPLWQLLVPAGQRLTAEFAPPRSGEFVLILRTVRPEASGVYDLRLDCFAGCERETTRFPVVMVHGWTGWDEVLSYDYFYQVPRTVRERGFQVFVASLDPYNSIEVRSGQLALQVDGFLAESRARKVNFIAHSQGGLDSRRVISTLGYADRVSSLLTISTPHRGTELTDVALGILPGFGEDLLGALLDWLGATVVGSESDAIASFESMTTGHVRDHFNPANPNHPDVAYISYAGRTCLYGLTCGDICDIQIRFAFNVLTLAAGDNDGIVPVASAIWGDYRGELPADHFDEVGQLFGVTNANFEHRGWYLGRFRDLAREGH